MNRFEYFFFLIFNLMLAFGKREEGETSDLPRVQLNNVCILSFDGRDEAILVFTTCERGVGLRFLAPLNNSSGQVQTLRINSAE